MLPRNMGSAHRMLYAVFGAAAVVVALVGTATGPPARIGLALLGLVALASSVSGY